MLISEDFVKLYSAYVSFSTTVLDEWLRNKEIDCAGQSTSYMPFRSPVVL